MKVDYIIVGQGIAGSMVAHFLLQQHKKIIVIDEFSPNSASNIAVGVVNPVTGRRMAKSWMVDELLPFAKSTYRQLEQSLQISFFFEEEICKLFSSDEDVAIWNKKKDWAEYKGYLGDLVEFTNKNIKAPFGGGNILGGCRMDVPLFISAYRKYLLQNNYLLNEKLDIDQLLLSENITYKNIIADKIIFCDGYHAHTNPFFNFIPFSLAKGEYLVIHSESLKIEKILNKNIYIIPKGDDIYTVGSTFIWDDLEEKVTETGRTEILDKLKRMTSCPYTVIDEKAGIRPTIDDRRPVIGPHQTYSNVYIFNGLGTKGVSLAPYFAHHLVAHLNNHTELLNEVSVKRFVI
ncbi:MAG: FAD-dependent oxidoreductase [Bacteroidota bacterium]|nr:FAD-dependent oxidoreductase [Bacteroidota bacterium]